MRRAVTKSRGGAKASPVLKAGRGGASGLAKNIGGAKALDLKVPQSTALVPFSGTSGELAPINGVSGAQMGFRDGTDGKPSLTWARYHVPMFTAG